MSVDDPLTVLPHQAPFRFLTAITDLEPGVRAQGHWTVTCDEPFLAGHFPGRPLIPGALIAEAMAQLAGVVIFSALEPRSDCPATVAHFDVRFRHPVTPPAEIVLRARLDRTMGALHRLDVEATCGDRAVADGSIVLAEQTDQDVTP
jgi:3-hydroxyacyl-[acyl-carrier-protein] dehydratase